MKLSVSLPESDVAFLDSVVEEQGYASRSAVLHRAVRLLHASQLGQAYEEAWVEWDAGAETEWAATIGDGVA